MLRHLLHRVLGTRVGLLAAAGLLLVLALSALRAVGADPRPQSAGHTSDGLVLEPLRDLPPHPPAEALVEARLADPFRPDRSPPPGRYSVDARSEPDRAQRLRETGGPLEVRLRGIALYARIRLALIEDAGDGRGPRVYRAGDSLGALVVRLVAADSVVLAGPDTTFALTIERPWKR